VAYINSLFTVGSVSAMCNLKKSSILKGRLPSSSNYRNGWEKSVNGIFVTEHPEMVGVPKIFTDIVTIKHRQWFWSKPMIVFWEDIH
jgi:hypothetical protein